MIGWSIINLVVGTVLGTWWVHLLVRSSKLKEKLAAADEKLCQYNAAVVLLSEEPNPLLMALNNAVPQTITMIGGNTLDLTFDDNKVVRIDVKDTTTLTVRTLQII